MLEFRIIVINRRQGCCRSSASCGTHITPVNNKVEFPGCYLFAYPSNHRIFNCGVFRATCMRIAILISSGVTIDKAWQWAAASGTTGRFRILKGGSELWRGRSGHLAPEAQCASDLARKKKLYLCSRGFIEIMPPLTARYHAQIAFRSTTRYPEAVEILARLRQSDLLWEFFISWPDPCRSLKQQPGKTRGATGVEF